METDGRFTNAERAGSGAGSGTPQERFPYILHSLLVFIKVEAIMSLLLPKSAAIHAKKTIIGRRV